MQINSDVITRKNVVDALTRLRLEIEDLTFGTSLVHKQGSLGLLLYDMANFVGLTSEEKAQALGQDLVYQIEVMSIGIPLLNDSDEIDDLIDWSEWADDQNLTLGNN